MLKIDKDTWVIAANSSECKIFSGNGDGKKLKLLKGFYSEDPHLQSVKLGNDRPGRVHESVTATRHAIEPKSDLHSKEKIKFSDLIADYLNKEAYKEEFYHLFLIASPEFLGRIRKKLNKTTSLTIVKEIDKDLTSAKNGKILELLC